MNPAAEIYNYRVFTYGTGSVDTNRNTKQEKRGAWWPQKGMVDGYMYGTHGGWLKFNGVCIKNKK